MKLYLASNKKIQYYSIPIKVEDSFVIEYKYDTNIVETIIFKANKNKWEIIEKSDIKLEQNGASVQKVILENDSYFKLIFNDIEEVIWAYCFKTPVDYFTFDLRELPADKKILIGSDLTKSNIIYNYEGIELADIQITILCSDKEKKITCNETGANVYLNGYKILNGTLKIGDVIFVAGLKIIWLGDKVKVNNPKASLQSHFGMLEEAKIENKYTPLTDAQKNVKLFTDKEVFFHTPRIKYTLEEKVIAITSPPSNMMTDEQPIFLTIGSSLVSGISSAFTALLAIYTMRRSGQNDKTVIISQVVMCGSMLIASILFPVLIATYSKRKSKKNEKKRQIKYGEYLDNKVADIDKEKEHQVAILRAKFLSVEQCKQIIDTKNNIWNREIKDDDFLELRLGIGNIKAKIKIDTRVDDFSLDDDNLKKRVEEIEGTPNILEAVPITFSLIKNPITPIIIDKNFTKYQQFINFIMLQIMAYYSGADLKIAVFTKDGNAKRWEYLKYTSYCFSSDYKKMYFATDDSEMRAVSYYLEQEFDKRKGENDVGKKKKEKDTLKIKYKEFNKYYLIITDNSMETKNQNIFKKIAEADDNYGFSILIIDDSMKNIPSVCENSINLSEDKCYIFDKNVNVQDSVNFKPEFLEQPIEDYAIKVGNIPLLSDEQSSAMPTSLSFLEMYKVGNIEQLNIANRWNSSDPTRSLATPLGVDTHGKTFYIDLHEKEAGPHGLIAGSTGSGKSEFIITFILSMAVSYHPNEVQFVIIDYKGGGVAGAFYNKDTGVKIPHLIGTITNLDESEMNRSLVSIKSELKRRQKLFNEARNNLGESTMDIYKYQELYRELKVDIPISHLFIISDEFAELKQQQPDFMNELVSTARIGRSLGVHLILATQKPAGVVDDQIWSNSRFKLCLKVQTPEDSQELLKRPEAAYLTNAGSFYLQVGYNESFEQGQSAWSGAKYIPSDTIKKSPDDSIIIINNSGEVVRTIKDVVKISDVDDRGEQLTNIVKSLYDIAVKDHFKFSQLWLPSIPENIYLGNLVRKYDYHAKPFVINPVVGEYDIPAEQLQKLLTINFMEIGNLILYGTPGSGKAEFLMELIYSICAYHSPQEVNLYLFDFGAEVLKKYINYPQVGDVVLSDELHKVSALFDMLRKEIDRRKELFLNYGGKYNTYIETSGSSVPFIMTIINNYEGFLENCPEENEMLARLLRESSQYGIIFVTNATSTGSVYLKISQCFNGKIAFKLTDVFEYRFTFNAPEGLIPANYMGRGIIAMEDTAYEFQTANICEKEKLNETIKNTGDILNKKYANIKVKPIPIIPRVVNAEYMISYIDTISNLPIGVDNFDASVNLYNFAPGCRVTRILGNSLLLDNGFILDIADMIRSIPNVELTIFDLANSLTDIQNDVKYINGEYTTNIADIKSYERKNNLINVVLINGIGYIYDKVLDEGIFELSNLLCGSYGLVNTYFVLVDNYSSFRKLEKEAWYNLIPANTGIWVGKGVNVQKAIQFNDLKNSDAEDLFSGIVYSVVNGEYRVIKGVGGKEDNYEY